MNDPLKQFAGSLVEWTFIMPSGGSFQILAAAEAPAKQAATCKMREDRGLEVAWTPGTRIRTFIGSV